MEKLSAAAELASRISTVVTRTALCDGLAEACEWLGVRYFALSHHVDFAAAPKALRLHNYPAGWEDWYDANRLGLSDPIHRASHRRAQGFFWREVPELIPMNRSDQILLDLGKEIGLGDGVTIPVHVPGEATGSCSFVCATGVPLPCDALLWAQAIGAAAFEGARRLQRQSRRQPRPPVSERQRQCVALAGRGMSNGRIAKVLGIGEHTVVEYFREARARFGVRTRTQLVVKLLHGGELCFHDCDEDLS